MLSISCAGRSQRDQRNNFQRALANARGKRLPFMQILQFDRFEATGNPDAAPFARSCGRCTRAEERPKAFKLCSRCKRTAYCGTGSTEPSCPSLMFVMWCSLQNANEPRGLSIS
jgi:hypothetical protein